MIVYCDADDCKWNEDGKCKGPVHPAGHTALYIRQKWDGRIRRIGDNRHDQLTITEGGQLRYYNLQNGEGCTLGEPHEQDSYEFVANEDEHGYNLRGVSMDRKTEDVLKFMASMILPSVAGYASKHADSDYRRLCDIAKGDFSDFEEYDPVAMTAWEPIASAGRGRCGTCRYLDTSTCFTTYPPKYACTKSGGLHFESDVCDVPSLADV